jgi:four helix bundle protein
MRDLHELVMWERAHQVTLAVYSATRQFPNDKQFGPTSQRRRAAASIAANLAEGCRREGSREFLNLLKIWAGSASEVEDHLILAGDLGYRGTEEQAKLTSVVREVKKLLYSFSERIRADANLPRPTSPRIAESRELLFAVSRQRSDPR